MQSWLQSHHQVRQTVTSIVRAVKSRRREELALGIATTLIAVSAAFNNFVPDTFRPILDPWSGRIVLPLVLFTLGIASLVYGVYRLWKLTTVPKLPPPTNRPSAIKGPLAFTPEDGDLYRKLGREDELRKLLGYIQDDQVRMVILMGASGAGKTSLLRAGLTDILKNTGIQCHYWEAVPSDSADGLLVSIQRNWKVNTDLGTDGVSFGGPEKLSDLLNPPHDIGSHVIIIDQFEQILGSTQRRPMFRFLRRIARESKPPHRITWIIAFRREFRADWAEFMIPEYDRRFFPPDISLRLFTSTQARDVTSQLVQAASLSVEQKVINNLIEAVSVDGEVSSVDIGIGLMVLFELYDRQGAKTVTQDTYHFAGGAEGLLTQYIQLKLDFFPEEDRKLLLRALLALCSEETNQRIAEGKTIEDLATEVEAANIRRLKNQLERLAQRDTRLLEQVGAKEGIRYRLPHERLIPALDRLAGRLIGELDEVRVKFVTAFAAWKTTRSSQYLLTGRTLRLVERYEAKIRWGSEKVEKLQFLKLSRRDRAIKRWSIAVGAVTVLLVVGFVIWAIINDRSWKARYPVELANYQKHLETLELDAFLEPSELDFLNSEKLESLELSVLDGSRLGEYIAEGISHSRISNLTLYVYGDTPIDDLSSLPNSVRTLTLNIGNDVPSLGSFPQGLTELTLNLGRAKIQEIPPLPGTLTELTVDTRQSGLRKLPELPPLLQKLSLKINRTELEFLAPLPNGVSELTLDIAESGVSQLPQLPDTLVALTLNITDSRVKEIPTLPVSLKKLGLIVEGSEPLPRFPDNLSELELNLSYNQMETLPPLPSHLTKLRLPIFQGQVPPEFPGTIAELTLDLIYDEMTELPRLPENLSSLVLNLNYQGNHMEAVPNFPGNLKKMALNLGHTRVKRLPPFPESLTHLSVDLTNTKVERIPELPKGLTELTLDLDRSLVQDLPLFPSNLSKLDLALSNSKVRQLPQLPERLREFDVVLAHSDLAALPSLPSALSIVRINANYSKLTELPVLPTTLDQVSVTIDESKVAKMPSLLAPNCRTLILKLTTQQRMSLRSIPTSITRLKF